jgi:perosamine synthetase
MKSQSSIKIDLFPGEFHSFFKGRVALYAILKALDIQPGNEVVLPGFTCVVVPSAVLFCGAKPIYVDIDPFTYNLNLQALERSITSKTKCIIIQHTYGLPIEMDPILDLANKRKIPIIEDCAHSLGSRYKGRLTGTLGDAAFFSTQWNKPFTTGLGGFAFSNDPDLNKKIKAVTSSFPLPSIIHRALLRSQYWVYKNLFTPTRYWTLMGFYRRLTDLGLVIGSSGKNELELEKPENYELRMGPYQEELFIDALSNENGIRKMITHRKAISRIYEEKLQKAGFMLPLIPLAGEAVILRYPVRIKNKKEFLKRARENKIEIGDWFVSPLHPNLKNFEKLSYRWGQCPQAERISQEVINLPTHLGISENEALRIIAFVQDHGKKVD